MIIKKHLKPLSLFSKPELIGIFILIFCSVSGFAQTGTLVTSVEAESGVLSGGVTKSSSIAGFSGTGYVTNFKNNTDKVTVIVIVPTTAFYSIFIRYNSSENKYQDLIVNKLGASSVYFPKTIGWTNADGGKYFLHAGNDTITIQSSWGWTNIDQFKVYTTALNSYKDIVPDLVDTKATTATKSLYNFLLSQFGKKIISGQTDGNYYDTIKSISGRSPLYRVYDFQHYTEGYAWLWGNGGFTFGIDPGANSSESAIAWYNSTGKKGIVGFQWHWHSPTGGTAGTNTFYTEFTTFDIRKAIQKGTAEYNFIIRDIDAIAVQLKKFQAANVPVLFRPLHEAGGGWFWWGAHGPEACKQLYAIMFDRLSNYHQLHNLVWTWSTYETDWYPGNDKVDIVGMDSYPGNYNYGTQKNTFDRYFQLTNGQKLIAMTENGPIPDPDNCLDYDSPWSLFMSWGDLVMSQNERSHIKAVYTNPRVLTLENDTIPMIIGTSNAFVCGSGAATLSATSNFGTVNWYAEPIGGTIINTGTSYKTPVLTEATTFYVEASYKGYPGEVKRTAVKATISIPPATPVISLNEINLLSNAVTGNQWYFNNALIPDAVNSYYSPAKSGDYYSIVTLDGCSSKASNVVKFISTGIDDVLINNGLCIYPNPVERDCTKVTISGIDFAAKTLIKIFDANGKLVHSDYITGQTIDLGKGIDAGIYLINVISKGINYSEKLIVK